MTYPAIVCWMLQCQTLWFIPHSHTHKILVRDLYSTGHVWISLLERVGQQLHENTCLETKISHSVIHRRLSLPDNNKTARASDCLYKSENCWIHNSQPGHNYVCSLLYYTLLTGEISKSMRQTCLQSHTFILYIISYAQHTNRRVVCPLKRGDSYESRISGAVYS